VSTDKLEAFRRLILSTKTGNIEMTNTISEVLRWTWVITSKISDLVATQHIQEDFVRQRKAENATSPEELKQTITVARSVFFFICLVNRAYVDDSPARLIGLTKHESTVTVEGWEHAKELNKRRKARFA